MDAYLSKPIVPNALFDVVDRQLLGSSAGGDSRAGESPGRDAFHILASSYGTPT